MRGLVALGAAATLLAGCMQDLGPTGDAFARDAAKGVVNGIVQTRFPGVDARPITDCIIDNASSAEIFQIAEAALVGSNQTTTNLVVQIASRPENVSCALNGSLGVAGLGL